MFATIISNSSTISPITNSREIIKIKLTDEDIKGVEEICKIKLNDPYFSFDYWAEWGEMDFESKEDFVNYIFNELNYVDFATALGLTITRESLSAYEYALI